MKRIINTTLIALTLTTIFSACEKDEIIVIDEPDESVHTCCTDPSLLITEQVSIHSFDCSHSVGLLDSIAFTPHLLYWSVAHTPTQPNFDSLYNTNWQLTYLVPVEVCNGVDLSKIGNPYYAWMYTIKYELIDDYQFPCACFLGINNARAIRIYDIQPSWIFCGTPYYMNN